MKGECGCSGSSSCMFSYPSDPALRVLSLLSCPVLSSPRVFTTRIQDSIISSIIAEIQVLTSITGNCGTSCSCSSCGK